MTGGRDVATALAGDLRGRWVAISEYSRPVVVVAGAGTGKTTTLVARLLHWCLGPGWDRAEIAAGAGTAAERIAERTLRGVVAITFTEAAAAEMAEKTAAALGKVAAGEERSVPGLAAGAFPLLVLPEERRRRAAELLGVLDRLSAQTIHAFCLSLLARFPLEANVHPLLRVDADGALLEAVVREVVERHLEQVYPARAEAWLRLAAHGFGPREAAAELADALRAGLPAAALAGDPLAPEHGEALRSGLLFAAEGVLAAGGRLAAAPGLRVPGEVLAATSRTAAACTSFRPARIADWAELVERLRAAWPDNLLKRLGCWGQGELVQKEAAVVGEGASELGAAARLLRARLAVATKLDPELLDLARTALAPLAQAVEDELRRRGIVTFPAILVAARRLLDERTAALKVVREGIDQLLVDEFQDTDAVQCDILRLLALTGPPAERPGLFLVGDPKQSIFAWRNADLAAYEAFVADVEAAGGERCALAVNYRSTPEVLAEVERLVAPVMIAAPGLQPPFAPLVAAGHTGAGASTLEPKGEVAAAAAGAPAVEHWVSWAAATGKRPGGAATRADDVAALEAQAIASDIRSRWAGGDGAWNDFAILLRGMTRVETFLTSLREAGVPFAVNRDKSFYRRREIIEAAALVRAVVNPLDHIALLTVLRSALAGVPDAALLPLWRHRLPEIAMRLADGGPAEAAALEQAALGAAAEVPPGIPGLDALREWPVSLLATLDAIAALRRSFRSEPADRFLARLRGALPVEPLEAARYLGRFRLANLERFFLRLERAIEEGGGDLQAVLRGLQRAVAESREAEEARPREAAEDAVQVLTIHGAKGLEFAHVYLAQAGAPSGDKAPGRPPAADARNALREPPCYALFGAPTPARATVEEERRRVEAAERVRILYVALTRAKRRLVVVGCWPAPSRTRSPEAASTTTHLLASRRGGVPDLAALWAQAQDGGPASITDRDALWRFPALAPPAPPAVRSGSGDDVAAATGQRLVEAARIAALRPAAARHMARPFGGTASGEDADRLRDEMDARVPGAGGTGARAETHGGREVALAAGRAVHRALEAWDLTADPAAEGERLAAMLPVWLAASGLGVGEAPGARGAALARAMDLLARFASGALLGRLRALAPSIAARELPLVAPAPAGEDAAASGRPVGFVAGVIDLLARDSGDEWLIVDYKTDEVTAEEASERAGLYLGQGRAYAAAVEAALGLRRSPRVELWFLWADRAIELPST